MRNDTHNAMGEAMPVFDLPLVTCLKCGYQWVPRSLKPKKCPACNSFEWFKEDPKGEYRAAVPDLQVKRLVILDHPEAEQELNEAQAKAVLDSQEYKQKMEIERRKLNRPLFFKDE